MENCTFTSIDQIHEREVNCMLKISIFLVLLPSMALREFVSSNKLINVNISSSENDMTMAEIGKN